MPKFTYPAEVKAEIVKSVVAARKAKKSWAEAYAVAKEAGYTGNVIGLQQMIRKSGEKGVIKRRGRKAANAPAVKVSAKPAKRGPGRSAKPATASGMDTLDAMVAKIVSERVNDVLARAIAVLVEARGR